ncbi:MAG: mechanosensitive ion channel domain-containing protein, partial [Pseudomonadota bacterium]
MSAASTTFMGILICALALLLSVLATDVRAQDPPLTLGSDLSQTEFQAMLGRLSDEQVRDILIAEFAARREGTTEPTEGFMTRMRSVGEALTANASTLIAKWPTLGGAFTAVSTRLSHAGGFGVALLALGLSLAIAFAVRHFWRSRASRRQIEIAERNIEKGSYGTLRTIVDAAFFLVIELSGSVAFALTAMATLYLFFQHPDLRFFASSYIAMVTVVLVVRSVLDFMFPLNWPIYRLVALSDQATRLVHWVVLGLASLWMFETTTSDVMARFGAPEGTPDLFSLVLGVVWIVSALTGIALVNRATTELLPPETDRSLSSVLTRNWAAIMTVSQILTWMLFTGGALASGNVDIVAAGIFYSMMAFIGLWMGYRILIHYLRAQPINEVIKTAIARAARSLLLAAGVLMILSVWGLDSQTLAAAGGAGNAVQTIVNVALTALVCWAVWEFLRTIIDLRVEAEKPGDDEEDTEGEGGLGASRSATLLPLLRSTALVVIALICLFTALSSLGVNVAPLIAGAGVIGLAIGFGAQTLVNDIVSGVFFLIDDAFRRGEYIDLGTVKGTVERIS